MLKACEGSIEGLEAKDTIAYSNSRSITQTFFYLIAEVEHPDHLLSGKKG
jgi:hypothetical protein